MISGMNGKLGASGHLGVRVIRGSTKAPLAWRLQNAMRKEFIEGAFWAWAAQWFTWLSSIVTITSKLSICVLKANGERIDYGVVAYRLVTDAAVAFWVDDMDNSATDITTFNYHGVGVGTTAEAASQTALVTESTTALNPDSTRATGTKTQPSANILRSVGTVTFDATAAITEHGVFSQAATGGGTLLDRSLFSAVNVASADSIKLCGFAA